MPLTSTILVITFERKRGRLVPTTREVSPTEAGALRKAEAVAGRKPGAAAVRIVADDDTGDVESATVLQTFGEVPDDFAESLTGG